MTETSDAGDPGGRSAVPDWPPAEVRQYIDHVVGGRALRRIARAEGLAPSTVSRRVRRVEALRDDPLRDAGLRALARAVLPGHGRDGWDYVLVGRAEGTATVPMAQMERDLIAALARVHRL